MKKVPDPDPAGQKSPDPDPHPCCIHFMILFPIKMKVKIRHKKRLYPPLLHYDFASLENKKLRGGVNKSLRMIPTFHKNSILDKNIIRTL